MELTQYVLPNGMNIILHPNPSSPVVACNVCVGVGSADETPKEAGLAHVHEHMLFKGTERRGVGQLAREVEAAGGHINAFTSFDQTCYYVVMSSRFFDTGLDILSDALEHSSFEADELERELEVIQEEIKRGLDSPGRVVIQKLFETAYAKHPYRLPVIGTSASVDSFEREDILRFYKKHYVPENMTLVLAGNFDVEDAKSRVDTYFGAFHGARGGAREVGFARDVEPAQEQMRIAVIDQGRQDTNLRVSFHIPKATHDDIPALELLATILGQGEASFLHQKVHRELELAHTIFAAAYTLRDNGLFLIGADYQLGGENEAQGANDHSQVLAAAMEEVFAFVHKELEDTDVQRARTLLESQAIYSKQTIEGLAMKFGHYAMVAGDPLYEKHYYERLKEVTPGELRAVARKYLTLENCTVVLSHPKEVMSASVGELEGVVRQAFASACGATASAPHDRVRVHARSETKTVSAQEVPAQTFKIDADGFVCTQIEGGPKLIIQENHAVELFSMRAFRHGGLRQETPETNGISALLSELMTRGTPDLSAMEIAYRTEAMAASMGGMSGRNTLGIAATGLSRFFDPCMELLSHCFFEASIPEDEFEREVRLHIQGLKTRQEQLGSVTYDRFSKEFFGTHPYAMPTQGTIESIQGMTAKMVRAHMKRVLVPHALTMAVVGDVDASVVVDRVSRLFARPDLAKQQSVVELPAPQRPDRAKLLVGDLEKQQGFVLVGLSAPTISHKSRHALDVLQSILSGQGGRLFMELRDKQSLAYSVGASTVMGLDSSAFMINIGTSPEKIEQAVLGIFKELEKLSTEGVTHAEIEEAKRYLVGNHDIGLQRNSSRAMSMAIDELYGHGYQNAFAYGDLIEAVDADAIQNLVEEFLDPTRAIVAITKPEDVKIPSDLLERALQG